MKNLNKMNKSNKIKHFNIIINFICKNRTVAILDCTSLSYSRAMNVYERTMKNLNKINKINKIKPCNTAQVLSVKIDSVAISDCTSLSCSRAKVRPAVARSRSKVVKLALSVIGLYILSWSPYQFLAFCQTVNPAMYQR